MAGDFALARARKKGKRRRKVEGERKRKKTTQQKRASGVQKSGERWDSIWEAKQRGAISMTSTEQRLGTNGSSR